eukprot:TRINITY_DN2632_c0_g1_i1.p1 TRINITY_DN2632_c0_g1~~TRINITY_DN2632_c0_g1_i1.p1  ORF type:complete len:420 (-),score=94.09 TRINITY_DN2632_c0_g1_i1:110-1369(-)
MKIRRLLFPRFITHEGLENLSDYEYSGVDKSIIYNYAVNPAAKALCNLMPKSLAANVLTLGGLLCSAAAYALMAYYVPTFQEAAPRWVYYTSGGLVFLYMMLDAMDGTQARRTNMASPMGELFDHLCDSLSLTLCTLIYATTARMTIFMACVTLLVCFVPFALSHWDDYNTGKLIMGRFGGPTDVLVLLTALQIITGAMGSHIWLHEFGVAGHKIPVNRFLLVIIGVGSLYSACSYIYHVRKVMKEKEEPYSWLTLILQLFPFMGLIIVGIGWLYLAPFILQEFPHQLFITMGLINAYFLACLIVKRITKEPAPTWHIILFVFGGMLFISWFTTSYYIVGSLNAGERYTNEVMIYIVLFYAFVVWVVFFASVIDQISRYLGKPVLTVTPPEDLDSFESDHQQLIKNRSIQGVNYGTGKV